MIRFVRLVGLLLLLLAAGPVLAVELEPIPVGADLVLFVNNHSGLPLGNLLDVAPVPAPVREKINEFFAATSFNPLKDISRVQVMVKKGATKPEDNVVIVLAGTFNRDKILDFLKSKVGQGIEEEKSGDLTLLKSKDGKGGLCFLDNTHVAFGTLAAVNVFIEAKSGTNLSTEFDGLKSLVGEKAYVALMVGGKGFLKKEMEKNHEKRKARREMMQRAPNPVGSWLEGYLTEGVNPQGVFAQILDNRIEGKILYGRGDSQGNSIQGSLEINDPKITISTLFAEFLKVLPTLPAPAEPSKPEAPAKTGW